MDEQAEASDNHAGGFRLQAEGTIMLIALRLTITLAPAQDSPQTLFEAGKYGEAATAFQDTVTTYGSSSYASLAQLEAANALRLADRNADAAQAYQAFLDGGAPADYLRQTALARLGAIQEASGQPGEAQKTYAAAAAICADSEVRVEEAELLRGICDMLDCPMPPLLPGQRVAARQTVS